MELPPELDVAYSVDGYGGIAFWLIGPEKDWDEEETGQVIVRMVGDDRDFAVSPSALTALDDSAWCGGCGQIGCGHFATT